MHLLTSNLLHLYLLWGYTLWTQVPPQYVLKTSDHTHEHIVHLSGSHILTKYLSAVSLRHKVGSPLREFINIEGDKHHLIVELVSRICQCLPKQYKWWNKMVDMWHDQGNESHVGKNQFWFFITVYLSILNATFWSKPHCNWKSGFQNLGNSLMFLITMQDIEICHLF